MKTYLEQRREGIIKAGKKKKAIAKRSKKMIDQMKIYNRQRIEFLKLNPICPITGTQATEIHHKAGRIGKMLLDTRYWLAVSRRGHQTIENNPEWAKRMGYSLNRLSRN